MLKENVDKQLWYKNVRVIILCGSLNKFKKFKLYFLKIYVKMISIYKNFLMKF